MQSMSTNLTAGFSPIQSLNASTAATTALAKQGVDRGDFAEALQRVSEEDREKVRENAAQFVATAFIKPMFDMMRDSPFKSDMFHGGYGEDVFSAQLHQTMGDSIASSGDLPLVDAIAHRVIEMAEKRMSGKAAVEAMRKAEQPAQAGKVNVDG